MLRLDNMLQMKVRINCFSASLWVCLASYTEHCIVIVLYHFNHGSVHFILSFSNINILYIVLVLI